MLIISKQFSEGGFPFTHHNTCDHREIFQHLFPFKGHLRPAQPDISPGQKLWQFMKKFLYHTEIPDIAGYPKHIRISFIDIRKNLFPALIDGVLRKLYGILIFLSRIFLQIMDCRIGMDVF